MNTVTNIIIVLDPIHFITLLHTNYTGYFNSCQVLLIIMFIYPYIDIRYKSFRNSLVIPNINLIASHLQVVQ